MKTLNVGGLNPLHRFKTLADALAKAQDDDTIVIHKNLNEQVTITKNVIIKGSNHVFNVPQGKAGIKLNSPCELHDLIFKVATRANAFIDNKGCIFENIKIDLFGPIRDFYPVCIFQGSDDRISKPVLTNCELISASFGYATNANLSDCKLSSYYKGDIFLSSRADMSGFYGKARLDNCQLKSCILAGNITLNDCHLDRFVDFDKNAVVNLNNCVIDQRLDEVKKNRYKKEPDSGPLKDKVDSKYTLALRPGSTVNVNGLAIENTRDNFLGFYVDRASLNLQDINLPDAKLTNKVDNANVSFTNVKDANLWTFNGSCPVSYVKSDVKSNRKHKTALQKLDELIGQNKVKEQIHTIMNTINYQKQSGNKDFSFSYHMIFAGNPGTGKSTIARIVAQALFEIGAIPENKLTMATSDEFVKGYVGQTGENTRKILDKALGGVLFIDEAYQLTVKDGENTFNDEVISVLIRYMEEHRDDLVVIAAGYNKEMKEFLASNTGLSRRFQWIQFEDYSPKELADIFEMMRKSYGDSYNDDNLISALPVLFDKVVQVNLSIPDAKGRVTNGGNGGLARNIYQRVSENRNNRLATGDTEKRFTKSDLATAFQGEIQKALDRRI